MSVDMSEPTYIQMDTIRAIRDSRVYDKNGEKLGKIDDLLVDRENNRVACAVLSFGSYLLGLGNQYFVIPLEAFKNGQHGEDYVLDVDKATLEKEESFRYEPLTQMKLTEAYTQYKLKPYWEK
jgi:sporulation protein YlmC with PRC-barrel domain